MPIIGNVVHSTYSTGTRALPGPAAHGLVRIYQAKNSCLWYKYNMNATDKIIFMNKCYS